MRNGHTVRRCCVIGRAISAAAILGAAGAASAQVTAGSIVVDVQPVATGLTSPITGVDAGDGSGRFYIVDQSGKILIMHNGVILPEPFLDLSSQIVPLNAAYDERGLLGIAFHPDYAHNGRFFVRYSVGRQGEPTEPCFSSPFGCHEEILAEFHVSPNPNHALPQGTILFRVNKPEFNHNSGDVVFGPDGFLYFTLGDGGGANDDLNLPNLPHGPMGNGQNVNVALGKIHRIDVDGAFPYAIPPTNPFANGGGRPEIFAWGLRNPYRFSFDNGPGGDNRMWLTDVGQDQTEELNIGQLGANYGWAVMEGPHCFDPFHTTTPPPTCNNAGMTMPIASYDHDAGIAIVGGFVYRGNAVPQLRGKYVFGDFSGAFETPLGRLLYIDTADPQYTIHQLKLVNGTNDGHIFRFLKGFGRDKDGEIYAMVSSVLGPAGNGGQVLKIVACAANCDGSTTEPVLNVNDFVCFLDQFAEGRPEANCDLSTTAPVLNINDFVCFMNKFASGCP
jgi:glucose/arabinose dehydrogenase